MSGCYDEAIVNAYIWLERIDSLIDNSAGAQFVHKYEPVPDKVGLVRHISNPEQCPYCQASNGIRQNLRYFKETREEGE